MGDTEVDQLHSIAGQHHGVAGLDVAVDEADGVGGLQAFKYPHPYRRCPLLRQGAFALQDPGEGRCPFADRAMEIKFSLDLLLLVPDSGTRHSLVWFYVTA